MRRGPAALLAALVLVAGCGGDGELTPGPEAATGRFAGSDRNGVGVSLDFTGFDDTSRQITAVLPERPGGWSVGIASIVNRSGDAALMPALYATRPNGRVTRLDRATLMRAGDGAVVAAPDPGRVIPADTATTLYVLFQGPIGDIRRVEMRVGSEAPVRLEARRTAPAPATGG